MSTSAVDDVARYLAERTPPPLVVPLALFLTLAATFAPGPLDPLAPLLAGSLVIQFRLWDDLADREEDRRVHPGRVLARVFSTEPFRRLVLILAAVNAAWLIATRPGTSLAVYLALCGVFVIWYLLSPLSPRGRGVGGEGAAGRWHRRLACGPVLPPHPQPLSPKGRGGTEPPHPQPLSPEGRGEKDNHSTRAFLRAHVVLLKYPVFVCLLAPEGRLADARFAAVLGLVYLTFSAYEVLHDVRLRGAPVAVSLAAMVAVALWLADDLLQRLGVVAGAVGLVLLYLRHRRAPLASPWPFAVFAVTASWLLLFKLDDRGGFP